VFPLFMVLLFGVVEFAFMFNAMLAVNAASRIASLTAAEAGTNLLADCAILSRIESEFGAPLDRSLIQSVTIYKADRAGNPISPTPQENVYARTGSTDCTGYTVSTVPYTIGTNTYAVGQYPPPGDRCDVLAGCSASIPLDSIGVKIVYRYQLRTPLGALVNFLPGGGTGYVDVSWSNVMRMEPIL